MQSPAGLRRFGYARTWLLPALSSILINVACKSEEQASVVVYAAHDRGFSEPILETFERRSGIEVLGVYDVESTKTIGLVNRIRAEKNRPRCDVFWNNEIVNTLRLKSEGLLQPCAPPEAENYAASFKDRERQWYGFAARARVLLVNSDLVEKADQPRSIFDLTEARWKGKIGIAKPLFGTTATHVACLFAYLGQEQAVKLLDDLKANEIQIMSGNKSCAEAVGRGQLHCGLTDTDDAVIEVHSGSPVRIVYLDSAADQMGTLFIPNTLAVIKGAAHPKAAEKLIGYLLSPEVEAALAAGPSAQIPLNQKFKGTVQVKTPQQIKAMDVDLSKAAETFDIAAKYIEQRFLD